MGTAKQQGEVWGARADDWASASEPAWNPLFEAVLDGAGVHRGTRMLDVGCGAGGALVLARQCGAEVTGLDGAAALVAIARRRLPGAEIEVGEMEELPFADEHFDVVTGINSFQFAGNLVNALAEARRVCRSNGIVAMLVWGKREDCDLLTKVMPSIFALLPPSPPNSTPPLQLSAPGAIENVMAQAGLMPSISELSAALEFADIGVAVRAIMSASARAIMHSGEERVRRSVEDALRSAVQADGSIRLDNRFLLALATRH